MKKWAVLLWLPIAALATWVIADRLQALDFADIVQQLQLLPASTLVAALACSCGVYATVGLYEGIALRLATGREMRRHAFRTALISNPIGRAIGAAIVSGGALRYRMYAAVDVSARQVGAVIVLVAMPFFFAVGWLIDLSLLFNIDAASAALRLPRNAIVMLGIAGLVKDVGWLVFLWRRTRPIVIRGEALPLPKLRDALVQLAFGLVQLSLMTAILYLLMPPELGLSWPAFIAIYCIAFVAGQLSNVPAGLGVLEAALLLMLPQVPPAKLLGAVVAYRAVYELLPLLTALGWLVLYESTHPSGVIRNRMLRR